MDVVEERLTAVVESRADRHDKLLRAIGSDTATMTDSLRDIVGGFSDVTAAVEDVALSVSALEDVLVAGFREVGQQLAMTHRLLSDVLPHPAVTEARDLYQIGMTVLRRGLYADAERKLLEAQRRDPSAFAVYVGLGQVYVEMGRGDDAVTQLELAVRSAETSSQRSYALLLRGRALLSLGSTSEAQRHLALAVEATPESAVTWYAKAQVEGTAGEAALCANSLARAVEFDPKNLPRALLDQFFDPVRESVTDFARSLEREAHSEALTACDALDEELASLEQSDLDQYVPLSHDDLRSRTARIRASVHPRRYLESIRAAADARVAVSELAGIGERARRNKGVYRSEVARALEGSGYEPNWFIAMVEGITSDWVSFLMWGWLVVVILLIGVLRPVDAPGTWLTAFLVGFGSLAVARVGVFFWKVSDRESHETARAAEGAALEAKMLRREAVMRRFYHD